MTSSASKPRTAPPIFFFRPKQETYGFLSQWYPSVFTAPSSIPDDPPIKFLTTEQYMMYQKAVLFKDMEIADKILKVTKPAEHKKLGRQVKGFDEDIWGKNREKIVQDGNWFKFSYNKEGSEDLKEMLLETRDRQLVEASPFDRIWGVGYGAKNAAANRAKWGQNFLGKALMKVRAHLQEEVEEQEEGEEKEEKEKEEDEDEGKERDDGEEQDEVADEINENGKRQRRK